MMPFALCDHPQAVVFRGVKKLLAFLLIGLTSILLLDIRVGRDPAQDPFLKFLQPHR